MDKLYYREEDGVYLDECQYLGGLIAPMVGSDECKKCRYCLGFGTKKKWVECKRYSGVVYSSKTKKLKFRVKDDGVTSPRSLDRCKYKTKEDVYIGSLACYTCINNVGTDWEDHWVKCELYHFNV